MSYSYENALGDENQWNEKDGACCCKHSPYIMCLPRKAQEVHREISPSIIGRLPIRWAVLKESSEWREETARCHKGIALSLFLMIGIAHNLSNDMTPIYLFYHSLKEWACNSPTPTFAFAECCHIPAL